MKHRTKQALSWLLSLALTLSLLPGMSLTAYAEASSGTIGNASYTIDDSGVLTVGSGDFTIDNWKSVFGTGGTSNTPNDTATNIKSVTFESGATLTSTSSKFMFNKWSALESVDLTNLTASNVTDMSWMFGNCSKLTSVTFGANFDTSKVQYMSQMFQGCSGLTDLDLSTFKVYTGTGKRSLYQTFYGCSNLVTIRVSDDWNVTNTDGDKTFTNCNKLVGGNGTKAANYYQGNYTYAVIDGKDGQEGFFTSASVPVEHRHEFTYSASGSTLTATCSASDCELTDNKVELTLTPPAKTVYGDSNSSDATLEGREAFNEATGLNIGSQTYVYYKKGSDNQLGSAPTTPGEYTVKVTISGVAGGRYDLSADYSIAQKEVGLTWADTEFNYDGLQHSPTVTATGLVGSDQCTVTVTGEGTEIGTYTAIASGLSNERYKLPDDVEQQFSIVAKVGGASYVIDDGVLTVKSGSFTGEQWNAAFANSKTTITSVSFEGGAKLSGSASRMFQGWSALAYIDFSNLTVSDVKDMSQMFQGCVSLTELDLSAFRGYTGEGTRSLSQMFSGCSNLVTIRVSGDWNVNNAEGSDTFKDCTKLIGGNGTKCTGTGDYTNAVIDKDGQPGYLTSANAVVHWHVFTYSASGDTLTATCSVDGCNLTDHQVKLTLNAPEKTVYDDGKSAEATLEGKDAFKTATGTATWDTISYYKKGSSASMTAPTTPGEYTAKVTISNVADGPYVLSVDYTIEQKEIGLTWGETTFHYDGNPHAPAATATGLVGNDKCDVIVTGEQTAIGNYTATASGLSNEWYKLPENNTVEFDIEGWLGTARYTIESRKAPNKSKMLLKATGASNSDDDYKLNDGNYSITNGVLTVYSNSSTSTFTLEDWRLAFANDNFIRNYRDNITEVVFSNGNETNVKLTSSAEGMFRDWAGLESIDFSGLDTSEVTWMQNMFSGCVSLTELDLSPLNTKSVQNMANMFYKCSKLKKITVGENWQTASSTSHMFSGCNALDGGAGTRYQALFGNYIYTDDDPNNPTLPDVDGTYARLDGGKNNPGFFYNAHQHQLSYTVDPNAPWKITATCSADGCYLGDSSSHSVSISLVKPTLYVYWMDELNKKDGEYDKGASPFATLTMQNVGDQTLTESSTAADPDGKINGVSFSVATFNDANTAAPTFKELTGATIGEIEYYEKGSDTKLDEAPNDAGTYTAKVTIGGATASVDYRIFKRFHSPVLKSPVKNASFDFASATEQDLITVEENAIEKVDNTDTSTFEFALGENATTIPTDGWSKEIPKASGEGPFYVFYRVAGDKNHGNAMESEFPNKSGYANTTNPEHESNSYKPAFSVIIVSNAAPIPPTPNELSYSGEDQALVTAGSATTGKMEYVLGTDKTTAPTDGWSDTIPTGKEPAVYYVWYRVVNANDTSSVINQPICVQVPLGKGEPTVTPPTGVTATYGQTLKDAALTNPTENPEGAWTWVNPGISVGNVGTNTFRATFTPTDEEHYKTVEADVTVTVGKANPTVTAPTGVTATYGQTLADVALPNPQSNIPGTWTWKTPAASVGNAGKNSIKANFTPNDTDNYNALNDVDVTVNVGKAANPTTVVDTATVKIGNTIDLADNVKKPDGVTGTVSYQIGGSWNDCSWDGVSVLKVGNNADTTKTVKVNVTIAADDNYEALPATPITVTISDQPTQTITAEDVEVTYGETNRSVSATVTESNHGPISYTVKPGSDKYIDVNATTGALTVKAVPLDGDKAYVIVKAAAVSGSYAETTKEVTVTIKRATTTVADADAPKAKELTYSGSAQELVTAGTASPGYKLRYALGNETAATEPYSDTVPKATNAGTYYVWYYNAVPDNNYKDSVPASVVVTVNKKPLTVTADDKSVIYGNPTPALTYTVTGLVGSDTLTGTLACAVAEAEKPNAGRYDITKGTLAASENYNLSFTPSTLKVLQAAQSRPESGEGYSISNAQVITIESGYEVINDQGVAVANGATVELNKTYSIRKAGNDNYTPSPYTDFTVTSVTIRATASPAAGGGITGASDYMVGASVTLTATPNSGYKFKEWLNESGISIGTDSTYTFKAAKNTSITAVFMQTEKTIVQIPTAKNHTYDGTLKTGVTATDNCIVQNGAKTGAGNYTATATLTNTTEFVWSDGTSAPKSIAWSIYKASQPRPSVTVDDTTATIAIAGNGKVEYKLSDAPATDYHTVDVLSIKGLTTNSTYHVRYKGDNNYLPSIATIVKVGSPYIAPTVKTNAVSALTATGATISGTKTDGKDTDNNDIPATLNLRYGTNANLSGATETEGTLTGLVPNTTYYYQAYATFTNGTEQKTIEGEILSFKTPASAPAATGRIDVSVSTSDDKTVYATIEQGNDVIAASEATAVNNTTHLFQFNNLSNGTYNVVVRTEDGKYTETHTITITADASTQATSFTILGGNGTLEAVVDIKTADTPKVAADGIRDTITEEEATLIQNGELSVKTALDVEKKTSGSAVGASEIAAIAGSDKTVGLFLDLSLIKTTSELDSGTGEVVGVMEENIGAKNDVVLQIAIPYADVTKEGLEVYRYHGSSASTLKALTAKPSDGFVDGTFFADTANRYLFIYAKEFSTYAVGYTTATQSSGDSTSGSSHSGGGSHSSSSGGGGSSSSDDTRYKVTAGETQHGTVSVSSTSTSSGTKVTITVKPDTGYAVDTVTVTGTNGKNVAVTKVNDTTYTYIQPGMDVKTDVTFKPASGADALAVFSDVNASDWYADAVRWALENGVMNGVGGGKFNPGGETSRAMVVTMLWRLEGSPAYVGESEFADVKNGDWYGQAVRWASAEGIVNGYEQDGGKVFNPNGAVTREQLATMLYRYAQHKGQGFTGLWSFPLDYPDASSVSEWAYEAMCWMTMNGVINGMDGKLAPASGASRAQVATMLMRYCTSAVK